jgi:hypothetical protein
MNHARLPKEVLPDWARRGNQGRLRLKCDGTSAGTFVFWRNGRVHLNQWGGSVQSTTGSQGVRISGSDAGYVMFRGSVKSTGYPPHLPVSPSLPLPCVTVYHHVSTGLCKGWLCIRRRLKKELVKAGIKGKTWREVKAIVGNRTWWQHVTEAHSAEME